MRLRFTLLFLTLLVGSNMLAQSVGSKEKISLEDIWMKGTFRANRFSGFNSMKDGVSYSAFDTLGNLMKMELATGKVLDTIVAARKLIPQGQTKAIEPQDYYFSPDESKLMFYTNYVGIYRRSGTAKYYVYDIPAAKLMTLSDKEGQMFASFAPKGNKVAFVVNNNVYIHDFDGNTEYAVTTDGKPNEIKNGWADWVYEEEFGKAESFEWNADGTKLAYVRYDESKVKEFTMPVYNGLYPENYTFKYPKAGEANSIVSVHVFDLASKTTVLVDTGDETDMYIPRISWSNNPQLLTVQRMNRLQNKLDLLCYNTQTKMVKELLSETANTYVDVFDDIRFLTKTEGFIWSSERSGFKHLYHYDMNGKLIRQITSGNWEVMDFYGVDEAKGKLYFTATISSPINRDFYAVDLNGKNLKPMFDKKGTYTITFSQSFKYYVMEFSDANSVPVFELRAADGKLIKVLEDNKALQEKIKKNYAFTTKQFFSFTTSEKVQLNGWMMRPVDFDSTKKYPVYMFAYGGPGSNEVNNQWEHSDYLWHQLLCQEGYLVVCVDGRGTQGRGRDFKHSTYLQLGKLETLDQIEVAKYLGAQKYVDKTRIGFQGWSFGGYLASLLITKGADYFKSCIAVAPVTNWRFYDNIYTERFLRTPQENPKGYDENSPIHFVKLLKGNYLLIHGSADDNVHLQNTMEMSAELVKKNIPFDQFIYTNKDHGIRGGYTRMHLYSKMLKFVREKL